MKVLKDQIKYYLFQGIWDRADVKICWQSISKHFLAYIRMTEMNLIPNLFRVMTFREQNFPKEKIINRFSELRRNQSNGLWISTYSVSVIQAPSQCSFFNFSFYCIKRDLSGWFFFLSPKFTLAKLYSLKAIFKVK